jgi:adenine/guanine/hypoxanthine permease
MVRVEVWGCESYTSEPTRATAYFRTHPAGVFVPLIGIKQRFETRSLHGIGLAIVRALTPHLAHWAVTLMNGALASVGTFTVTEELTGKMKDQGVLYRGLEVLGGGSILGGLILGAMAVCIIDRHFMKGAGFALAGAILTFFSFMHGHQIGIADDPIVAFSYLIVAVIFAGCAKLVAVERSKETIPHGQVLPQAAA